MIPYALWQPASYSILSRHYTVLPSRQEDDATFEYEDEDPSAYEPNDSSATALSQHLTPTQRSQLQEIAENGDLTLKQMRDIPVKLPSADYMSTISPELAKRAAHHPVFPLCDQLTYSIVMQSIAELYDYMEPLTEVYWDLNRAGWPPSRYTTRIMLKVLAQREIQVQQQLEAMERPNLIRAVKYTATTNSTDNIGASSIDTFADDIAYKSIQPARDQLMMECNLEQAMTIFLATPPEVRMSLHRTLLNLLLKAAAERGDPQAALSIFEWMNIEGRELPSPTMTTSLSPAKMKLLEEINEFHDHLPFSRVAQSVQLATRPSAVIHPSAVINDLFEGTFDPVERRHDVTVKRQHYRLQTPTHASYAELAGAFARVGDLASALMCIRLSEETRHLFRVRQPDLIHRRIAEMLARRGDLGAAIWMIMSRMRTDGIVPSSDCLRDITRSICDWDRVDYAAQFIKRVRREANHSLTGIPVNDKGDKRVIGQFIASYNEILEAACRDARDNPLHAQLARRIFNQRRQRTNLFYPNALNAYLQLVADLGDTVAVCEVLAELRASITSSSHHLHQASVTAIVNLLKRCEILPRSLSINVAIIK
ncbi:hypothetical protein BDF22DRAFT_732323 [Syncephalis plumigaleata]|nr:hypothetical protein BDF22DRAFT_732323 [Syncephalis plumigaleata]